MDKRISVRGIIIEDDEVYAIFRRKIRNDGVVKEYYVIPGGGMKSEETLQKTLKRELKEELSIDVEIIGYLGLDEKENSMLIFLSVKQLRGYLCLEEKN